MSRFGLDFRRALVVMLGVSISFWFVQRCYGYFVLGEDHPANKALQLVGDRPLFLSMVSIHESSLLKLIPIFLSIFTAFYIYVGLATLSALITYKVIKAIDQRLPDA